MNRRHFCLGAELRGGAWQRSSDAAIFGIGRIRLFFSDRVARDRFNSIWRIVARFPRCRHDASYPVPRPVSLPVLVHSDVENPAQIIRQCARTAWNDRHRLANDEVADLPRGSVPRIPDRVHRAERRQAGTHAIGRHRGRRATLLDATLVDLDAPGGPFGNGNVFSVLQIIHMQPDVTPVPLQR